MLLYKAKRQYPLTCKVNRYCLLALHGSMDILFFVPSIKRFQSRTQVELINRIPLRAEPAICEK